MIFALCYYYLVSSDGNSHKFNKNFRGIVVYIGQRGLNLIPHDFFEKGFFMQMHYVPLYPLATLPPTA